jgi:hypothetical protein
MSIREWLREIGRTPRWLADELDRPVNTVERWISGRHLPRDPRVLVRIEELSEGRVTAADVVRLPSPHGRPGRPKRSG